MAQLWYVVANADGQVLGVYGSALKEQAEVLASETLAQLYLSRFRPSVGEYRAAYVVKEPVPASMPCEDLSPEGIADWNAAYATWCD
jgi:hypothetical protein